mgnify:FL=1
MTTTVLTTKGQVVIPSSTREHLGLKKGVKFFVIEQDNKIILQPLTRDYFEAMAGIVKSKQILTKMLLDERRLEKDRENCR